MTKFLLFLSPKFRCWIFFMYILIQHSLSSINFKYAIDDGYSPALLIKTILSYHSFFGYDLGWQNLQFDIFFPQYLILVFFILDWFLILKFMVCFFVICLYDWTQDSCIIPSEWLSPPIHICFFSLSLCLSLSPSTCVCHVEVIVTESGIGQQQVGVKFWLIICADLRTNALGKGMNT